MYLRRLSFDKIFLFPEKPKFVFFYSIVFLFLHLIHCIFRSIDDLEKKNTFIKKILFPTTLAAKKKKHTMPIRKDIVVDGVRFKTRSKLRKHVQDCLRTPRIVGQCDVDYSFLHSLCERHHRWSEKSTGGVQSFRVDTGNALFVVHNDGSSSDISWNKCLYAHSESEMINSKLNKSMRDVVQPQIKRFRQQNAPVCSMCGTSGDQVDHIEEFRLLVKQFCGSNATPIAFDDRVVGGCQFRQEDMAFATAWIDFHSNNASLRITCRACNLKRPRPDIVAENMANKNNDDAIHPNVPVASTVGTCGTGYRAEPPCCTGSSGA